MRRATSPTLASTALIIALLAACSTTGVGAAAAGGHCADCGLLSAPRAANGARRPGSGWWETAIGGLEDRWWLGRGVL